MTEAETSLCSRVERRVVVVMNEDRDDQKRERERRTRRLGVGAGTRRADALSNITQSGYD